MDDSVTENVYFIGPFCELSSSLGLLRSPLPL